MTMPQTCQGVTLYSYSDSSYSILLTYTQLNQMTVTAKVMTYIVLGYSY